VADGFGAFEAGKGYGLRMAVEAIPDALAACEDEFMATVGANILRHEQEQFVDPLPDALRSGLSALGPVLAVSAQSLAETMMRQPRDIGSELHDAYHRWRIGELTEPNDSQRRFIERCKAVLQEVGLDTYHAETEVQFANAQYGGTADWHGGDVGLDWKTVKDFRDTKPSEELQLGAYAAHFNWQKAYIVYIRQSDFHRDIRPYGSSALQRGYEKFLAALRLWEMLNSGGTHEA
jgi:hypothetical protein